MRWRRRRSLRGTAIVCADVVAEHVVEDVRLVFGVGY